MTALVINKKRQWSDLDPIKIKKMGRVHNFRILFSDVLRFNLLPPYWTLLYVLILNWRVVVSLLYSRLVCFLIFTTAGIKCVVRERHMRPGGRIGSLALSLNQSPQIFFALFFYFLALFLDPFFLLLHNAILSFSASCYDFFSVTLLTLDFLFRSRCHD